MQTLIKNYLASLNSIIKDLKTEEIENFARTIRASRASGKTIFLIGNGGSASTASHFATDLGVGTLMKGKPVKAISLVDNTATLTAISNDIDYQSVFRQQIKLLGLPGDLLVLISASGNSPNLISALEASKEVGMHSFSLTGFDGGKLKELTLGQNVHVSSKVGEYGLVEDAHAAICHIVTECIRIE